MKAIFDIYRWADWASKRTIELQREGAQASVTFTSHSKASEKPAFFVDLDYAKAMGRVIFWSTGDYAPEVMHIETSKPVFIAGWPRAVTDENFEEVFSFFVATVRDANDGRS